MLGLTLALAVLGSTPEQVDASELAAEGPFAIANDERISVTVPHAWRVDEALERVGYLLAYWKERFKVQAEWHGNRVWLTGKLLGRQIRAVFLVTESQVVAIASDPGWPLRGRVQPYVEAKLKKYLHPTYAEP